MTGRELNYVDPLGPDVRIGVLQAQTEIRLTLRADYRLIGGMGELLADLGPGHVRIFLGQSQPPRLGYRLVVARLWSEEKALEWIREHGGRFNGLDLLPVRLGHVLRSDVKDLSSLEYWVCSRPLGWWAEADEVRDRQPNPERIDILPERLSVPSGVATVEWNGRREEIKDVVLIRPAGDSPGGIVLHGVRVGIGFHWEHLENQRYRGSLEIRVDNGGKLTAINILSLEHYLWSVNSSEMMASHPPELLKAQTIAARNTVLATMGKHHAADDFDVCADDHCQCYRGYSRETEAGRKAALETVGQTLSFQGRICDCRYSKSCGGISENFDSVWPGEKVPYMTSVWDGPSGTDDEARLFPADSDERALELIRSRPEVYCNTASASGVPEHLRYSADYFRWQVSLTRRELEESLSRFPAYRVGEVRDLEVVGRGASGRIEALRVVGSERSAIIRPQYDIREALAPFFLYSSAIVWDIERDPQGRIEKVNLRGAGWGHGVGMCQVGATMMAHRGKSCSDILTHYYRGTGIASLYLEPLDVEAALAGEGGEDPRLGDRCFEFFNCYAVAECPVYLRGIDLVSGPGSEPGTVEFSQAGSKRVDLEGFGVKCQFLRFREGEAEPVTAGSTPL